METDYYNIQEDWELVKKLIQEVDPDINKFIGPKRGVNASVRARTNLNEIRKLVVKIRKKILLQREDNASIYD